MSLPVVPPGSCCPVELCFRDRSRGLSAYSSWLVSDSSRPSLPTRPLLSLGLLQLLLGVSMLSLSAGALSLSGSQPVRAACPLWASSSVILSGVVSLTTWKKPVLLLDDPRVTAEEREEAAQVPDPEEFVAPPPPPSYFSTFYLHTPRLAHRMLGDSVIPLPHIYGARIKGVEVFCPLDPPPPYEAVAGSSTHTGAQDCEIHLSRLTLALPLQGTPVDERETVDRLGHREESRERHAGNDATGLNQAPTARVHVVTRASGSSPGQASPLANPTPPPSPPPFSASSSNPQKQSLIPCRRARIPRSSSDPVLMDLAVKAIYGEEGQLTHPQTTDSSTQTSQTTLARLTQVQVILRRTNERPLQRPRPSSMVDYQSYRHTQQLVRRILEQPTSQGLTDEVKELVASIRSVLQSDQEYMDEAVHSASYLEQVFTDSPVTPSGNAPSQQQGVGCSQTFPRPPRKPPGLLHLQSCGDLSSFTCSALDSADHQGGRIPRTRSGSQPDHPERPHSLIGVFRETVL